MSSKFQVGSIVEGKITEIKPFGAFIALDESTRGLVHISQVAHGFVKDINDILSVGDTVKVKIISIDENSGKISLSIRETQEAPAPRPRYPQNNRNPKPQEQPKPQESVCLEDKLKDWLKQSNERQADLNKRNNRR